MLVQQTSCKPLERFHLQMIFFSAGFLANFQLAIRANMLDIIAHRSLKLGQKSCAKKNHLKVKSL